MPGCAAPDSAPLALVERQQGAVRLVSCDPQAAALGLAPGLSLADARARTPDLRVEPAEPDTDLRRLERIADACERYTPMVAPDHPHGLVLDISGCAHLFGGEEALAAEVTGAMRRWTGHLRLGLAGSPEAARALARFGRGSAINETAALQRLPVAALELDPEAEAALRRAGLKTIADLEGRPHGPLAARFGADAIARLDRMFGRADSRIAPRRPPPELWFERRFAEPVTRADDALAAIGTLAAEAGRRLEERGQGGRHFAALLFRSDGAVTDLRVESGLPLRDPVRIMQLFDEQVGALADPIDPGFGFDMIRLAIPRVEPLAALQLELSGGSVKAESVSALVDRLSARLGRDRIQRFGPRDRHIPEQAVLALPAIECPQPRPWPAPEPGEPPLRPIHLFDPPQPVEVIAEVPDGPPRRFRWRRTLHEVTRCEGPERIAAQWWRGSPGAPGLTRDYYRLEDSRGRRFWLFRHGLYGEERADPRWYIHGLFA